MYGKRPFISGGAVQSATHHIEVTQLLWKTSFSGRHLRIYVLFFTVQQELQGEMPRQALWWVPYRTV
jgi:hypothetical protein